MATYSLDEVMAGDAPVKKTYSLDEVLASNPQNVTDSMGTSQRFFAGVGKGMTDLVRGGGQLLREGAEWVSPPSRGLGDLITDNKGKGIADKLGLPTSQDVARSRELDSDLMNTTAGKVGNFTGQLAGTAPLMLIPGANTYAGAGLIGAGTGALQPTTEDESRLTNTVTGAVGGMAGQKLGNVISDKIKNKIASDFILKSKNATKDASLQAGLDAGYSVPRSLYQPTFLSNRLESVGGKAATLQQASINNQDVTNNLVRKALDLPEDAPLSMGAIEKVRQKAYEPYQAVADLSTGAKNTLKELKQARADAKGWFNAYNRSARPDELAKAQEYQSIADMAEEVLEDYATAGNKPELIKELRQARKTIAKTYTVERAMNKGSGDINAHVLGRLYDKGKPLSDGLDEIGRFATTFPKITRANQDGAGISALEPMASAMYATAGHMATGNPMGMVAGGLPLLRQPARALALSRMMQKQPNYGGGLLNLGNEVAPMLPYLGTVGGGLLGANSN